MKRGQREQMSDSQKNILLISALDYWSMGKGRGGPALYQTLSGYARAGWHVFFITGNRLGAGGDDQIHDNIHIIRFDALFLRRMMRIKKVGYFIKIIWWLYFQVTVLLKAIRLSRRYKIDVVYGYEIAGVPAAKILSKLWHVPMVSRFQGTVMGTFWSHKKFISLRAWDHALALRMPTDLVIMTNDGTQGDKVLEKYSVETKRVKFWMNGVDWDAFEKLPQQPDAKKLLVINQANVLLTISRLVGWKRVERTIIALPDVIRKWPDTLLVIVGDGPERSALEALAMKIDVASHVRFEGAIAHAKIFQYLAAADIFLSLYDMSNVGNPLLEAMMAGKCIITLNNGDTGRIIRNGYNGVLLEYEDLPAVSTTILNLLTDEQLRQQLGANALAFAKEHFWTWDERMAAEIKALSQLLH